MLVGFANMLVTRCGRRSSRARWSSAGTRSPRRRTGTRRSQAYQSGREFAAGAAGAARPAARARRARSGFAAAKAPGYEADDFLAAAVASEEARGGRVDRRSRPTATRSSSRASGRRSSSRRAACRELARVGPAEVRERYGVEPGAGAGLHRAPRRPVRQAPGRARRRPEEGGRRARASTARSRRRSRQAGSRPRRRTCGSTGESRRWTPPPRFLPSTDQTPTGRRRPPSCGSWGIGRLAGPARRARPV